MAPPDPAASLRHSLARQGRALEVARVILGVFDAHQAQFRLVTRRAEARFLQRDWRGGQQDAAERLTLYRQFIGWCVQEVRRELGEQAEDLALWRSLKEAYFQDARPRLDAELALTFFNSVVRQVVRAVGPEARVYFDDADFQVLPPVAASLGVRTYTWDRSLEALFRDLLHDLPFTGRYPARERDALQLASALAEELVRQSPGAALRAVEVLPALFYRNKGAYLVGRVVTTESTFPLVLAMVHDGRGLRVDALLATPDEVSIVFSFTRSYFHVEVECPRAMVEFLRSLMPRKPLDELYTSLGNHKHGKTELVRALLRRLEKDARFEAAEGDKGLVMAVFALPSLNVVFKIIKDRFGPPKHTTRQQVMEKYHLVFVRDRVGRLADAQEFEGLEFERGRFAPGVLQELLAECGSTVRVEGDRVILQHLYTERLVTPLNLYLRQVDEASAIDAVLDYGQSIKDLAAANIFTGDMLLKNFGVTRNGRVIFYDYDELCLLTECRFRAIPAARHDEDEYSAEPWFSVGERDVFPEEFRAFLTLPGRLGEAFSAAHGDLLTVEYWQRMQRLAEQGEVVDIFPYKPSRRLGGEAISR